MKSFSDISQIINSLHELGETTQAANFLIEEYSIKHTNFGRFELRKKAKPEYILMTTEGIFGQKKLSEFLKTPLNFHLF